MRKPKPEIIGILYRNDDGTLQIINDTGSHDLLIDPPEGHPMPLPAVQLTELNMVYVDWGNGQEPEYWAEDIWHDLLDDMKDEGHDVAGIFEKNKNNVFPALLIG